MRTPLKITAAVTAALAGGTALAAVPSFTAIQGVPLNNTIYISGSSAMKGAISSSVVNTFCGGVGNTAIITTTQSGSADKNWLAFACTPATGQASNSGVYFVSYRFEGGSVAGPLPIVNETNAAGKAIGVNFLYSKAMSSLSLFVNEGAETNGQIDSFTTSNPAGGFTRTYPDIGIADVEPKAITGNNYPTDYCTAVWGATNQAGMFGTAQSGSILDEVYALYVTEGTTFTETPLNLNLQTVQQIMAGNITDWSAVTDIAGNTVVNASTPILVVNREYGSGSRTAVDILFAGDHCSANGANQTIIKQKAQTRYFSTGDVLGAAATVAGAISYASIDNSQTGMTMVSINNVAPSNLAAALGTYPFWVEATYLLNPNARADGSTVDATAVGNIIANLQQQGSTAALADILVIPNVVSAVAGGGNYNTTVHLNPNGHGLVPSGGGTATVYINPWTRQAVTCSVPAQAATSVP